jgi:hypothetical protein
MDDGRKTLRHLESVMRSAYNRHQNLEVAAKTCDDNNKCRRERYPYSTTDVVLTNHSPAASRQTTAPHRISIGLDYADVFIGFCDS